MTYRNYQDITFPFLHDAVYCIQRIFNTFRSCYMDRNGGVCLRFAGELTVEQIQQVLFELHYFGPYSASPDGPAAEIAIRCRDYDWSDGRTLVYSRPWVDYRKL